MPFQVNKKHYEEQYENFQRFVSYFNQIHIIKTLDPKSILEIGVGSKFLYRYLKSKNYDITTADYDISLRPDIICDIRNNSFKSDSFDLVCAFEVLEHIPYEDALLALKELRMVTKKYIVISVPRSCAYFGFAFVFGLPIYYKILSFSLRFPFFFIDAIYGNKQHQWELGRKNYSIRRFINDLKRLQFKVYKKYHVRFHTQHYFIILEKCNNIYQ